MNCLTKKIRIMLFAGLKEAAGNDYLEADWKMGQTAEELKKNVMLQYPKLQGWVSRSRLAGNKEFLPDSALVCPDIELALIPPVSGG
jgi:molybdopterin converting factor small subunit